MSMPRIFAPRKDDVKPYLCGPSIPLFGRARLNGAVNKYENRRRWLLALKEKEGGMDKLAEKIGTDPNYLSSLLGPSRKRNPGDDLARRTEEAYELAPGVLDLPSATTRRIMLATDGLTEEQIDEVLAFIEFKKSGAKN